MPPDQWGFVFTWLRTNCYTGNAPEWRRTLSADGKTSTINSPENVEALQFFVDLIQRNHRAFAGEFRFLDRISPRQSRHGAGRHLHAARSDPAEGFGLRRCACAVPFRQPAVWCNSHNLCLRDLSGRQLDAAKRFVKYLSDNSLDWAEGGQVPVRKSLRNSARFQR